MASLDTAPAALDTEQLARDIEQAAAKEAHTIGEYTSDIRGKASALLEGGGELQKVGRALGKNATGVQEASDGSTSIKVDDLEPGLNGFTEIGGSDSDITVSTALLSEDPDTLAEVIDHEKRHNDQVPLQSAGGTLLVTASGEEIKDDILLYEGDTETHTAETLGYGRRADQPEEYAKGHDIAEEIRADHEEAWNETLTEHGDPALLQKEIWAKALNEGTLTMEELTEQASKTRYNTEAAEVISEYVKSNGMEYAIAG
ncbi:MAG TPA: hypothetical protein VHA78_00725 [Candidatus Peribacteraceae bacterium]|nr:hypothetical protein [Candidatus Peribacteraceae bacterium]